MEYLSGRERFSLLNPGEFQGFAVTWRTVADAWIPTRFFPGAFTETLKDRARPVKLTWGHDLNDLIGMPLELIERPKGLWLHGRLTMTRKIQFDYLPLVQSGVIDALSIGWNPETWDMEADKTVPGGELRNVRKAELVEIALVGLGADPKARIDDVAAYHTPQRTPRYTIAQMERLVAQYRRSSHDSPATAAEPLFRPQGADRPETDSQYSLRLEKSMQMLLQHEASEAYYRKAKHDRLVAYEGFKAARQGRGY